MDAIFQQLKTASKPVQILLHYRKFPNSINS